MKIRIPSELKKVLTLAEMPAVREIQRQEAEDTMTVPEYLKMAAHVASGDNSSFQIFDSSASIAKNCRVCDYYGAGSGNLDVWLEGLAFNAYKGAYLIGVYLSDINQVCGGPSDSDIRNHMYIREYLPT